MLGAHSSKLLRTGCEMQRHEVIQRTAFQVSENTPELLQDAIALLQNKQTTAP